MEWLVLVLAVAAGLPAAAWLAQDRLIFFPQPLAGVPLPPRTRSLELHADGNVRLRGWIRPGVKAPSPTLIYFGGNAEEVSVALADPRWPQEWTIVAFNYRGYGESEGKPAEASLVADAKRVYDLVAQRPEVDSARIVAFGRSLGTGVATQLAAGRPVAGVVLVSPFDSLVAIGREHYPFFPVGLALRHRFESATYAPSIRAPLLAIAAEHDAIVAPVRSQALFDAWGGPKTWRLIARADHNTIASGAPYWDAIREFLRTLQ